MISTKLIPAGVLLAMTNTLYAAIPVDGTYSPRNEQVTGIFPPNLYNFSLDIVNDAIVDARGQLLLPGCAQFGLLAGGVGISLDGIVAYQGLLSTIVTRDAGRYVMAQNVDVSDDGKVLGIKRGNFMGMYADITFNSTTEATMNLYSALTYFTGNNLESDSCIGHRAFTLELAD